MKTRWIFTCILFSLGLASLTSANDLAKGKQLYTTHCAACHGPNGDGQGPMASSLFPKPRDFTTGVIKYRTTRGAVPSDLDFLETMKKGIPGTSMPGWDLLSLKDWKEILAYVKSFSPRFQEQPGRTFDIPDAPKATPELVAVGAKLFARSGCDTCHGAGGRGDGAAGRRLKDVWGDAISPRDLTKGPLKWGNTSKDIYRTTAMGIPGTPMPAFEHVFTKDELWALTSFVKSLQKSLPEGYDPSSPKRTLLSATYTPGPLSFNPQDQVWAKSAATPVFLKPLWSDPAGTEWLTAKAIYNDREIALLLSWEDDQMNTGERGDAAAVQFPVKKIEDPVDLPFLGIGGRATDVDIWRGGKASYANGMWSAIFTRSLAPSKKGSATITGTGYLAFALWDGDLPRRKGPSAFSEWMIYELQK